jgi:hypothetical protein
MPINNTPASRDVIGSPANRRSQRGDVCLQFSCSYKHAYLPAGVSARGFLCMRILSSSHRSFLFLCAHGVGVGVAWLFFLWRAARVRRAYMHASGRVRGCSTPRFGPFYTWRWSRRWWRRIPTWPRGRRMGSMSRVFVNVSIARWEGGWRQSSGKYLAERYGGGSIFGWR